MIRMVSRTLPLLLAGSILAGCSSSGVVNEELQRLRADMSMETKKQVEAAKTTLNEESGRRITSTRSEAKQEVAQVRMFSESALETITGMLQRDLTALREMQVKGDGEIRQDLAVLEKSGSQNSQRTDEVIGRVNELEGLLGELRWRVEQETTGEISSLSDGVVTISLGRKNGLRDGELVEVHPSKKSLKKIATVRITEVRSRQASGEVVEKGAAVAVGNPVRMVR